MEIIKMLKSKFRSVLFVPHTTLMLLIKYHTNQASSFGEEDFKVYFKFFFFGLPWQPEK